MFFSNKRCWVEGDYKQLMIQRVYNQKIAFLSDPHLIWDTPVGRTDNIVDTEKEKFEFILDWCDKNNAVLIISGDLFDTPRSWRVLNMFLGIREKYRTSIHVVKGQHDTYFRDMENNSTTLGVLLETDQVWRLRDVPFVVERSANAVPVHIYGCDYGNETIPVVREKDVTNILVIHKMITDRPLWYGHEDYTDAERFLEENKDFKIIHCGDAHRTFIIQTKEGRVICNTGPLLRLEANEAMFEHRPCFFVYDLESDKMEVIQIPHKPAEEVLSRAHIEREHAKKELLDTFIESVKDNLAVENNQVTGMGFMDNLQMLIKTTGVNQEVQDIISKVMEEVDHGR